MKNAVHQAQAAYWQQMPVKLLQAAVQHKKKVIRKVKTASFREKVHRAVTEENIWQFMCWAKEKSHLLSESLIIFSLKKTVNEKLHCVVTSQKKAEMLKRHFFSDKLQINLSDMKDVTYFLKMCYRYDPGSQTGPSRQTTRRRQLVSPHARVCAL